MEPTRLPTVLVVNPAADVYGSDLQVLQSISAMKSQGWEVVVASPRGGPLDALLRERGARPIRLPFPVLRRASISLRLFPSLCLEVTTSIARMVRLLRRERPDLLYVN